MSRISPQRIALFLVFAPVLLVYGILTAYIRNVPMFDDYHALLEFACGYVQAPSVSAKLALIASAQHGMYKLIFEHALVAIELSTTGRINFAFWSVIGNFLLLGIAWFLWKCFMEPADSLSARLMLFAPVAWFLFTLNYVETLDWAMCSMQGIACIFFALGTLYGLTRSGKPLFAFACAFGFLAALSSANGFFIAVPGFFILFRQPKRLLIWTAVFGSAAAIYLFRYTHLASLPDHVSLLGRAVIGLSFWGAAAENMHRRPIPYASLLLGCGLLGVMLHATVTRYDRRNRFAMGLALWIALTTLPVCLFRAEPTLTSELSGRYKIYSDLLLIVAYSYAIERLHLARASRFRWFVPILAGTILFSLASDALGWRFLARRYAQVQEGLRRYEADPGHTSPVLSDTGEFFSGPIPEQARETLGTAKILRIYDPPVVSAFRQSSARRSP